MTNISLGPNTIPAQGISPESRPLEQQSCIDIAARQFFADLHDSGEFEGAGFDMIDAVRLDPIVPFDQFNQLYEQQKQEPGFSPLLFAERYCSMPTRTLGESVRWQPGDDLDDHAARVLMAHVGTAGNNSSTRPRRNKVVQSGGRYSDGREERAVSYYWDSADIVDGLDTIADVFEARDQPEKARVFRELADGIVDDFRHEIITTGRAPRNANAPEYDGRSQPHKYVRMVRRDVRREGPEAYRRHLPAMLIEFNDIMQGADDDRLGQEPGSRYKSVVRMSDGSVGTVFSAEGFTFPNGDPRPRPESRPADVKTRNDLEEAQRKEIAAQHGYDLDELRASGKTEIEEWLANLPEWTLTAQQEIDLYEQLHTGGGAGTDFAPWMMGDNESLHTIRITKRVPPFKMALVFELACEIAEGLDYTGDESGSHAFKRVAYELAKTLNTHSYHPELGYLPYDTENGQVLNPHSQDGSAAIEAGMAPDERMQRTFELWEEQFKAPGGLLISLDPTELSWGHRRIWPTLQASHAKASWLAGEHETEEYVRNATTHNIHMGRLATGHTVERYDAYDLGEPGGGGEYDAPEHNFSWTDALDAVLRHASYRNEFEREAWEKRRKVAQGVGIATTGSFVYCPAVQLTV